MSRTRYILAIDQGTTSSKTQILDDQGETVIAFDVRTGTPLGRAISWQDRRTEEIIQRWRAAGLANAITRRCGLRLDPYFSAGKLAWILEHDEHAQRLEREGHLRLGTSDAWLVWMLTGGEAFVADAATASRTMMLDLEPITLERRAAGCIRPAIRGTAAHRSLRRAGRRNREAPVRRIHSGHRPVRRARETARLL